MTTHLPSTPRRAETAEHADSSMAILDGVGEPLAGAGHEELLVRVSPAYEGPSESEAVARVLVRPVFLAVGDRRRKLLRWCGYLGAAACLAYLAMISFSLLSSPVGRAPASVQPAAPARTAPVRTAELGGPLHRTVTPTTIPDQLLAPLRAHPAAAVVLADGATVNHQVLGISRASVTRPAPISVRTSAKTHSRVDRDDTRKPSATPAYGTSATAVPARGK